MGSDLPLGCEYRAELKDLKHLVFQCPLLSGGRTGLFWYLTRRCPGLFPELSNIRDLIFDPNEELTGELRHFFWRVEFII